MIMSRNFAKTLVWKHGNDVKLWRYKQCTSNTNDHHMTLNQTAPRENFLRTPLSMTQKLLHLRHHSQKIRNPDHKVFFRVQARTLANPLELLNSSLAQSAEQLWRW